MSAAPAPDLATVRRTVEGVVDPGLPALTLGMLGMVADVRIEESVVVELLPTFAGCPAMEMIERDVVAAVSAVTDTRPVRVRFRYDPPWSARRISASGRRALRELGIAPPGGELPDAPAPQGRTALPLARRLVPVRACPYCGSADTVQDAAFGPTPCRDVRWCHGCRQPFEAFKNI